MLRTSQSLTHRLSVDTQVLHCMYALSSQCHASSKASAETCSNDSRLVCFQRVGEIFTACCNAARFTGCSKSVHLSVMCRYCIKTNECRMVPFLQLDSAMYLVFGNIRFVNIFARDGSPLTWVAKESDPRHRNMGVTYSVNAGLFTAH